MQNNYYQTETQDEQQNTLEGGKENSTIPIFDWCNINLRLKSHTMLVKICFLINDSN